MNPTPPNSDFAGRMAAAAPQRILRLPAVRALGIQVIAFAGAGLAAFCWALSNLPALPLIVWALLQGSIAAMLSRRLAMDRWWLWIHLIFPPALLLIHWAELPSWVFLSGFFLLFIVHGATYRTQVPTHLSRREAVAAVAGLLPSRPGFRCIDLGCGFGGVLGALARTRRDGEYRGIEGAILPFVVSWIRGRLGGYRVRWGDLWDVDLGGHDVVYAYLSPAVMTHLWTKARREMRPGAILISNNFSITDVVPTRVVGVGDRRDAAVYLWRIGDVEC